MSIWDSVRKNHNKLETIHVDFQKLDNRVCPSESSMTMKQTNKQKPGQTKKKKWKFYSLIENFHFSFSDSILKVQSLETTVSLNHFQSPCPVAMVIQHWQQHIYACEINICYVLQFSLFSSLLHISHWEVT